MNELQFDSDIRWYQQPLHEYMLNGGKRAFALWHRRAGKDHVALDIVRYKSQQRVGSYWTLLPEYSQGRKALWTAVDAHTGKRRIDIAFPHEIRETTNEQEMFIRFKNGSTWQIVGSDKYDSLVGAGVAGVVFSEWALSNPSAWTFIRPMLVENDGWAMFITTPRGRNHAKTLYDYAKTRPDWFTETLTADHTQAVSPENLKDALDEYVAQHGLDIGQALYEQEYLCSFNAATLGAFYARECLAVRHSGRLTDKLEPEPGYPIHRAWDLGYADSTAIWWFQNLGTELRILDYYEANTAGIDHYADVIKNRGWNLRDAKDYVPHDARQHEMSSGRTRIEAMFEHGLSPVVVPRTKDADGHQAIRTTLPRCFFHTRTEKRGFLALESYRREWDDNLKDFKQTAKHDWASHGAKAFQYLAQAWRQARPQAPEEERPPARNLNEMTLNELWEDSTVKRRTRV